MPQNPEDNSADNPREMRLGRLEQSINNAHLARLEQAIDDLSARLRAIEQHLNVPPRPAPQTEARPFGQGAATSMTAPPPAHTPPNERAPVLSVSRATTGEDATTGAGAGAAAEGEPAEEYPFNIPPARGEETAEPSPFAASGFGAADARSRASSSGADAGGTSQSRVGEGAPSSAARARRDVESIVGGSLFNWLGIIAVTVAVGFFLKLAFEHEWIGPAARVLLGGAAGCGVLALAEFLRARGYRAYAHVLTGGGILILYLSVYAARGFYELVGVTAAFALMTVVTATAVALSVRHDARSIAVLALIGGFMTPALLSTGVDRQIALFTYVAFLDAGVLALAYFKRWRVLDHLAFAATVLTFVSWYADYFAEWKSLRTVFFLTLFFLMFSALAVLHNVLRKRKARWLDLSLVIANATLYFASVYALLETRYAHTLGGFALLVALLYALLAYVAHTYHREDRLLSSAYVGAAATFLAVAVAVQFQQHWITIGWAAEGLALTWLGLRTNERAPRYFALAVFTCAVERWFTFDMREFAGGVAASFIPVANAHGLSCAALVGALALTLYLYRRAADVDADERDIIASVILLIANALALTLLSVDLNDYFNLRAPGAVAPASALDDTRHLALTLLWALYAACALAVGVARRLLVLRLAALFVLFICAVKLVVTDAPYYDAPWHLPLFNQTFAAFAVFVVAVAYVARVYARSDNVDAAERRIVVPALAVVGNLFAVAALSLEASGYFRKQLAARAAAGVDARDLRLAQQLSLSLVWAVYGGAMLAFGLVRQNKTLRLLALMLLAATTAKVFLFDLSELEQVYRIVSFIVLGLVLLGVSFLYQQRLRRAKEAGD
ncbi:MAG: DUF2339 domain-containing protein [Pyrinomonadaceae bacterium]